MNRLAIGACILISCAASSANDVLMEACNAVKDSSRRLECFKQLAAQPQRQGEADSQVRTIERAFQDMRSGLEVGMSYNSYQQQLLTLAQKVKPIAAAIRSENSSAAYDLEWAVSAYQDAGILWQESIGFYARRDNKIAYLGGLPFEQVGLGWLVKKYALRVIKADVLGIHSGINADEARMRIWEAAQVSVGQAVMKLGVSQQRAARALVISQAEATPVAAPARPAEAGEITDGERAKALAMQLGCTKESSVLFQQEAAQFKDYYAFCTPNTIKLRCEGRSCWVVP